MKPKRITLSRKKGWRMPPNTVKVDRTTRWGNPFVVGKDGTALECVIMFRAWLYAHIWTQPTPPEVKRLLCGKNLACWCKITDKNGNRVPCHADVLLEIANE